MKKDKKWLKAEVQKRIDKLPSTYIGMYTEGSRDAYHLVLQDIAQLGEPEVLSQGLPVIPKYVADWITNYRDKYDLYPALRLLENNTLVWGQIYEWYRMNTREFVNAFLTGEYEVEEEQKYNVQLKPRSSFGTIGLFLYKQGDEILVGDNLKAYYPEKDKFRLTEQEIKDFDERYWAFRTPV